MFSKLPQEQFGFILAYNYFDNMSMPYMQKMLKECFDLLKPGGKMLFTFNDCDLPHNIDLVEREFKYYTPGRLVKHYLENIGFTVLKHFRETYGMSWFEIEKPGVRDSVKGGQVLAQIKQKKLVK
jgi:SAM-dependent methyltransferase